MVSVLQVKGSVPKDYPHLTDTHTSDASQKAQVITCASDQLAIDWRFQRPPSLGSINLLDRAAHKTPGNTFFAKGYDKGYRWTARWRDTEGEVWEGPEHRSFCPRGGGVCHPPSVDKFTGLELSEAPTVGNFMEDSSWMCDQLSIPFPVLSPLWKVGGGTKNSKLLIIAWSFWWPATIQEPTQSRLIRTKDAPSTYQLGSYKDFRSPVSGLGSKTNIRTRDAPSILNTWEITRVSGALCQEPGAETNIYLFPSISQMLYTSLLNPQSWKQCLAQCKAKYILFVE